MVFESKRENGNRLRFHTRGGRPRGLRVECGPAVEAIWACNPLIKMAPADAPRSAASVIHDQTAGWLKRGRSTFSHHHRLALTALVIGVPKITPECPVFFDRL